MYGRRSLAVPAIFSALVLGLMAPGCGGGAPSVSMSKIVEADSEEGRKAQADDEAHRRLRHQQEAQAVSRKRGLRLPDEE